MTNFSLQNSGNRANGQYFEDLIQEALEFYYEKGFASIEKTPEPMRTLKRNPDGTFCSIYTERAQPDYKGVLLGGQAIIFEAKYTDKDRIEKRAVTKKQHEIFERYEKMGARCFVMVCLQGRYFYRIPWQTWKEMKQIYGHKYMDMDELRKYQVVQKGVVYLLEGLELNEYA